MLQLCNTHEFDYVVYYPSHCECHREPDNVLFWLADIFDGLHRISGIDRRTICCWNLITSRLVRTLCKRYGKEEKCNLWK